MSREVRRVPLNWQHPRTYNEHWAFQASTPWGRSRPPSKMLGETERFVGLCDDYPDALARWQEEVAEVASRTGHSWTFNVEYHLTGFKGHKDDTAVIHPWWTTVDDVEVSIDVRDEEHLHELLTARVAREKPDPLDYMPVWAEPEDELGWCLYETVSEGTPVTPVFATAAALIDHLATVGQDRSEPMRRDAAETLVRQGGSLGSFIVAGGQLFDSANDADKIASLGGLS